VEALAPLVELRKAIERREMFIEMNGEKVRSLREEQGLSKRELSRLSNVTEATVARAERGERMFPSTVRRLAEVLGVDARSLGQRERIKRWTPTNSNC
jgi:transcriptional regulator with XRE-family HTH domain